MPDSSLRLDVLTGRQVIVAPRRSERPGAAVVDPVLADPPGGNPFASGNEDQTPSEHLALRHCESRGNDPDWLVRVVPNQFPAVVARQENRAETDDGPLSTIPVSGIHDVVIESPIPHDRLSQLSAVETARVLLAWQKRVRDLQQDPQIKSITVFRNEGFSAGASLPHVHSQILATSTIPPQTAARMQRNSKHREQFVNSLLYDLCEAEVAAEERIVFADSECLVMCPWAGRVSWHVRIVHRKRGFESFTSCSDTDLFSIAAKLHAAANAIDDCARKMAMNVVLVQSCVGHETDGWFLDLMPRSARIAGYELATDVDIVTVAPESAAERIRARFYSATPLRDDVIPPGYEWRR